MSVFRKVLGVSWKMYEAQRAEVRELQRIVEALKRAKLQFEDAYTAERRDLAACRTATKALEEERDTLVGINRNLGRELHRLRGLFLVTFSSKRARELALENREVGLESLRQVYDGTEFSAKHVAAAKAIANREREREAAAKTNGGDRI